MPDTARAALRSALRGLAFVATLGGAYLLIGGVAALAGWDPDTGSLGFVFAIVVLVGSAVWLCAAPPRTAFEGLTYGSALLLLGLAIIPIGADLDEAGSGDQIVTLAQVLPVFLLVFAIEWVAVRPPTLARTLLAAWASTLVGMTEIILVGRLDERPIADDVAELGYRALVIGVVGTILLPLAAFAEQRLNEANLLEPGNR